MTKKVTGPLTPKRGSARLSNLKKQLLEFYIRQLVSLLDRKQQPSTTQPDGQDPQEAVERANSLVMKKAEKKMLKYCKKVRQVMNFRDGYDDQADQQQIIKRFLQQHTDPINYRKYKFVRNNLIKMSYSEFSNKSRKDLLDCKGFEGQIVQQEPSSNQNPGKNEDHERQQQQGVSGDEPLWISTSKDYSWGSLSKNSFIFLILLGTAVIALAANDSTVQSRSTVLNQQKTSDIVKDQSKTCLSSDQDSDSILRIEGHLRREQLPQGQLFFKQQSKTPELFKPQSVFHRVADSWQKFSYELFKLSLIYATFMAIYRLLMKELPEKMPRRPSRNRMNFRAI